MLTSTNIKNNSANTREHLMETTSNRRERCGRIVAAVIARDKETANALFDKIKSGELKNLYGSATEAETALDGYPTGHRLHYRVFSTQL